MTTFEQNRNFEAWTELEFHKLIETEKFSQKHTEELTSFFDKNLQIDSNIS